MSDFFSFFLQVSHLLAALQQGSRGTQACINAASAVQGIVSDLDTTVMFAATGTLQPETEGDTFGDHRCATKTNINVFTIHTWVNFLKPGFH